MIFEENVRKAKILREFGYSLLWLFLGGMIYFVETQTGRSYPMSGLMTSLLLILGLAKLGYAIYYYRNQDERKVSQD